MEGSIGKLLKASALGLVVIGAMHVPEALADCGIVTPVTYTIDIAAPVIVKASDAPNSVVRTNQVAGRGGLMLVCQPGASRFFSGLAAGAIGQIVPLQVGGKDAGVGVRVSIKEDVDPDYRVLPLDETRNFTAVTNINNTEMVRYELIRLAGPIEYGAVSTNVVAQSLVSQGPNLRPFRAVAVTGLTLARPSCSITAGTLTQSVNLGTHGPSDFSGPTGSTGFVPFHLTASDCDDPLGIVADITFGSAVDADPLDSSLFSLNAGGATGMGIDIATAGDGAILPGVTQTFPAVATGANFDFKARLKRTTAAFNGGTINRPVVVQVDFR